MTVPNERARAIILAWEFLRKLSVSNVIPVELRTEAHALLRHFPLPYELIHAARLVPDLLAEPAGYFTDTRKPNTVRTVIELLHRFDPELRVVVDGPDEGFIDLWSITQVSLPPDQPPTAAAENALQNSSCLDVKQAVLLSGRQSCNVSQADPGEFQPRSEPLMNIRSNKILFLDYDGVLHADSVFLEHRRPVLRGGGRLFEWAPHLISALERHPDVHIVLSTSWVRTRGFSRARDALPQPLQEKVIGATWHSKMGRGKIGGFRPVSTWWDDATRYQQITAFIARAKTRLNWLALDDDDTGWAEECRDRLVLTDSDRGLSDPNVLEQLDEKLASLSIRGLRK